MRSPQVLFLVGYIPQIIGVYFSLVELLDAARSDANDALTAALQRLETALGERRSSTVQNVTRLHSLLEQADIVVPGHPRTPDDFYTMREAVMDEVSTALEKDVERETVFLLGWVLGDATWTLNLLSQIRLFRALQPSHPLLLEQQSQRVSELREQTLKLSTLADSKLISESMRMAVRLCASIVSSVVTRAVDSSMDEPADSLLAQAAADDTALRALATQAQVLERDCPKT